MAYRRRSAWEEAPAESMDIYGSSSHSSQLGHYESLGAAEESFFGQEDPGVFLESLEIEGMPTRTCIEQTLPIIERLLDENRALQAEMQEAAQLQQHHLGDHSQSQQQLQQKYNQLKAYTLDLQARKKGDAATIENLQIQLKQYKESKPEINVNTAQMAGELQEQKTRSAQLAQELGTARQEMSQATAELTKWKVESKQRDDDYKTRVDEKNILIQQLQKQLADQGQREMTKRTPPPTPAKPNFAADNQAQPGDAGTWKEELQALQSRGLVRTQSRLMGAQDRPVPAVRRSVGNTEDLGLGLDYFKDRCQELEAKLAVHNQQCLGHVRHINTLERSLSTVQTDLEMEKTRSQRHSDKLGEMKANFELICKEYYELQERYQEHCVNQPPDAQSQAHAEVMERMDCMMAQIIAAEEMIEDKDAKIEELNNHLHSCSVDIQLQQEEIDKYKAELETEREKLEACEQEKITLQEHVLR